MRNYKRQKRKLHFSPLHISSRIDFGVLEGNLGFRNLLNLVFWIRSHPNPHKNMILHWNSQWIAQFHIDSVWRYVHMYRYIFHWPLCLTNHIHFYKSALRIQILLVLLAVPRKQRKHDDFSVREMRPVWPISSAL